MSRIRSNLITNQAADGAPTVQNGLVISGVTTSTTFSGSGASLTNLPSAQLTGALPALDGSNLTGLSAGTSLSGSTNNTVCTVTGANAIQGEANLTFDGTTLKAETGNPFLELSGTVSNGGNTGIHINANANHWVLEADNYTQQNLFSIKDGTPASSTARLTINSTGRIGINEGSPNATLHIKSADASNNRLELVHQNDAANEQNQITFKNNTTQTAYIVSGKDSSNNNIGLSFATGNTIRMNIDSNGYMTNNQPYGEVRFNSNTDNGGEQKQTNVYTHTVHNGMAHSSGRLTVPATGKYYIGIHANILDDGSAAQYLYINGSKVDGFRWQMSDSSSYWKSGMVSAVKPLNANDYLEVYVTGRQDNQSWNIFTVYMLG